MVPRRWDALDGKMYCPKDALEGNPDPTLPLNANFINDAVDLDAFVKAIASDNWITMEACKIANDPSKANTILKVDKIGRPEFCKANINIKAGEEITIKYGANYWFSHILHNPKFSEDLRIKSLMMLWTHYQDSPGTIPVKKAVWINLYGELCATEDAAFSISMFTEKNLDMLWKKITDTFINCFAYVNFERSLVLDAYVKALLKTWHKRLDDMAYEKSEIRLKAAQLSLDMFWFAVDLRKKEALKKKPPALFNFGPTDYIKLSRIKVDEIIHRP